MRIPPTLRVLHLSTLLLLAPLLLASCGGDGGTNPVDPNVSLSPTSSTLFVGDEVTLTATVTGTSGAATFNSSAPGVASVDAAGKVTGVSPGTATITASAGGASASTQITVDESSIAVGPQDPSLLPDETTQLTATVTGGSGHTLSWITGDSDVATVDNAGLVTAVSPGSTTVTASVDGQPGVEASLILEVLVPAPVLEILNFTDAVGDPLNLESITGVFFANMQISGYVGAQGAVELYFGDDLFASVPFTVESALPSPGSGFPVRREESIQNVPLAINSLALKKLEMGAVAEILANVPTVFSSQTNYGGQRSAISIRGVGTSTSMTFNNPPVGVVTATHMGPTLLVDGKLYGGGDVGYQIGLSNPGVFDIQRIEVLRGPQGTLYGSDAVAGVVNFVSREADYEGFEGAVSIDHITAFDGSGASLSAAVANLAPELFDGFDLEQYTYVDYAGPTAGSTPTATEDLIIGATTDFQNYLSLKANFGLSDYTDVTGISDFRWQVSDDAGSWDEDQKYTIGTELTNTNGFTKYVSAYARDGFMRGTRNFVDNGSGSFRNLAVDLISPTQTLVSGTWNLTDQTGINTPGDWKIKVDAMDPPAPGFAWSSGISSFDLRASLRAPSLAATFIHGDADGLERVSFDLRTEWTVPFSVEAEYNFEIRANDGGENGSEILSVQTVYNPMPSVLTIPTLTGLNSMNLWEAGSTMTVEFNSKDVIENHLATAGLYSPTAGLYYFDEVKQLGTAFDDTYENDTDLSLTVGGLIPRIEFTGGTLAGTGWHTFGQAGGGVVNTAGLSSITLADIVGNLPPAGPFFSESQLESWFSDQAHTEACLTTGPSCNGRSQDFTVSARGWNPFANGFPMFTEGQLYAMKFGPGGEEMFREVGNPVTVVTPPFGTSGWEVQLSGTFNAVNEGLTEDYDRLFWGLRSPTGDVYATDWWPMTLRYEY